MQNQGHTRELRALRAAAVAVSACALLLFPTPSLYAAADQPSVAQLTSEREVLTAELEQYENTLRLLSTKDSTPEASANPAVRKLTEEAMLLKRKLVAITEQEVTLLQAETIAARTAPSQQATHPARSRPRLSMETKPLRTHNITAARAQEAENVERLHQLLENYHTQLQASARILPTADELKRRELAQRDLDTLDRIPFSVDKVRLNGVEGSTALARITRRLSDPGIPESRRDIAPICVIKTRLFDTLVGSESRSLHPVGKNHYIARVRLQPGDTSLSILSERWELRLPQHINAGDFIITLYRPPGGTAELHVFGVDELLAVEKPHIPAWLPGELQLNTRRG